MFRRYVWKFDTNCTVYSPVDTIHLDTLWTGDAGLRLYITTVQDG